MQGRAGGPDQMSGAELRRRVSEMTKYRMSGQIELMLQYFVPEVIVHCHSTKEGLFLPGVLRGRDALRENIRRIDAEYEPIDAEVLDILVEKANTAVRWRNAWRHRGSGYPRALDMAHFLRWKDGLVTEMFEYLDYHGMMALACG